MNKRISRCFLTLILSLLLATQFSACGGGANNHSEHGPVEEALEKGPHNGRLLSDGSFSVEVTIFEQGIPPEYRVFVYENGKPIDPSQIVLTIDLNRFGGTVDKIAFSKREDYLLGDKEIVEPHSFDVKVNAQRNGKTFQWEYPSYEGRTELNPEAIEASGVKFEKAGPAKIKSHLEVSGTIMPNEDRMAQVIPRFPGVVKEVKKRLGDIVEKNEILAIVEGNQSLQPYEVRSPISGTVLQKNITAGEYAKEDESIFTVADLSVVWVDLSVYRRDLPKLKLGQQVLVTSGESDTQAESTINYISPFGLESSQSMIARADIPNPNGAWKIGLFVSGEIVIDHSPVPIAIKNTALQTFRDWDVVFMRHENIFEIAILELGRRDHEWTEILSGIPLGQEYVTENSFIIKADIGKSGASHDH